MPAMGWSELGTQFCLELAFGVLFALAFVPRAPVGALFYRIMGTAALVPTLLAAIMPPSTGEGSFGDAPVVLALVAAGAYPIYAGPVRGRRWALGLGVGLLATAAAVVACLRQTADLRGALELGLAAVSALATGAVAGSVGLAMVLGHWYLTVPNLQIGHLRRLNRVTIASMAVSALALTAVCLVFRARLAAAEQPLFGATGLFYLGTRVLVGLLMPLAFAAMAAGALRFKNTRSATGILYASTVLVLIGTAVAVSLQDTYGVPL
jgi:hypothetical protein